jgi:membrane-bound lytic murein transglycosylase B
MMGIAHKDLLNHKANALRLMRQYLKGFSVFLPCVILALFLFMPSQVQADPWDPLIRRLGADGFSTQWLKDIFQRPGVQFDPSIMATKMKTLYRTKFGDPTVRKLQQRLAYLGYAPGGADGKIGPKTRKAIRWFQAAHGLPVDGRPSVQLLKMAQEDRRRRRKTFAFHRRHGDHRCIEVS